MEKEEEDDDGRSIAVNLKLPTSAAVVSESGLGTCRFQLISKFDRNSEKSESELITRARVGVN